MTGKVCLICGKICSGKSFYADKLRREKQAVVLSVDEITLALFGQHLGDKHDEICARTKEYLFAKSLEITGDGIDVILDWGFWQKSEREYARGFYREHGRVCEMHYVYVSDEVWKENIAKRNSAVTEGKTSAYYVDSALSAKFSALFEPPGESETDVIYKR